MSRRDQIRMTTEEIEAFLHEQKTMAIATIAADGRPHVVAMWYAFVDGEIAFWTFAKSQKVVNLKRDPRITALVEDGDDYSNLRGVEIVARARITDDPSEVMRFGEVEFERYQGMPVTDATRPVVENMANKRVVVYLEVERMVSWDHRKLSGGY
jgi:PPOX class probable F420-dependent enzyme